MSLFGQLTQTAKYPVAMAGMTGGSLDQFDVNAQCVVETAAIEFGTFCSKNNGGADKVHTPASANDVTKYGIGFAKRDASHGFGSITGATVDDYAIGQAIPVVKAGPGMWVQVAAGITPAFGDSVYVRYGGTDNGKISNAAGTSGTAGALYPQGRVEKFDSSTGLAYISLNNVGS